MGVITTVVKDWDNEMIEVVVITRFAVARRPTLNRVANRASVGVGVGQRTLVAAAYDELGIDLVWNKGLGFTEKPEEKFPKAKEIEYEQTMAKDLPNNVEDLFRFAVPTQVREMVDFGLREKDEEKQIHIFRIPKGL